MTMTRLRTNSITTVVSDQGFESSVELIRSKESVGKLHKQLRDGARSIIPMLPFILSFLRTGSIPLLSEETPTC